jgi:ribose 5-phosphate isomerase B
MRIYLGSDHRGYELKEEIKKWLTANEYEVEDVGNFTFDPEDDFVDYGLKVAESIEGNGGTSRGILLCGSGHGMEMVANRFPRVRAILGFNDEVTKQGREHEDANVLVLPSDWIAPHEAVERVRIFLEAEASRDIRYIKRGIKLGNIRITNTE